MVGAVEQFRPHRLQPTAGGGIVERHGQSDWIVPREAPVAIEGFPRSFGTVRACDEKKEQGRKCQRGSSCGSGMSGTGGGHEKEEYQVSAQNRTRAILKRIRLD